MRESGGVFSKREHLSAVLYQQSTKQRLSTGCDTLLLLCHPPP